MSRQKTSTSKLDQFSSDRFLTPAWMTLGVFLAIWGYIAVDKASLTSNVVFNLAIGIVTMGGLMVLYLMTALDRTEDDQSAAFFKVLIILIYWGVVTDNMSWLIDGRAEFRAVNQFLSLISYLIIPFLSPIFWNYQNTLYPDQKKNSQTTASFLEALMIADTIIVLLMTLTGYLFTIDESGQFHEGNGYLVVMIYPAFVLLTCIADNLRQKIPLWKRTILLMFFIGPLTTIMLSAFTPGYSYMYTIAFIDLMLVYGGIQTERSIEMARKNQKLAEQGQALMTQQTQIMLSQIQPHFLYNTLSVIGYLCEEDAKAAQTAVNQLSKYLRMNMDSLSSKEPVPFAEELEHTKTYLSIEELRFFDILTVKYDITCTDFKIPPLTLQPMVENAVKYGVRSREDGGTVTIATHREGGQVVITVSDDGMGFDPAAPKKQDGRSHVGIENVRQRLEQMVNGRLEIDSRIGEGTVVTMIVDAPQDA